MTETETEAAEKSRLQRGVDLRAVAALPAGRRFLWRLLETSGVFSRSFSGDPLVTAHAEGRRDVGVALMEELQREDREGYVRMVEDQLRELRAHRAGPPETVPDVEQS